MEKGSCRTQSGWNRTSFINDTRTYDAVLRNIELIGEAATHIPGHVRSANLDIDWRSVIAARNRVAHGYTGIDDDVIWDIVRTDIPDLLPKLRRMLDSAQNGAALTSPTRLNRQRE